MKFRDDRHIEDTRQDNIEMIDPAEWWERVEDALPKDLWEFVDGEVATYRSQRSNLHRLIGYYRGKCLEIKRVCETEDVSPDKILRILDGII